jgi:hypothetical protein
VGEITNDDLKFERTPEMNEAYEKYKQNVKDTGETLDESIIRQHFSGNNSQRNIFITNNQFPYDVAVGVDHLVAWGNPNVVTEQEFCRVGREKVYQQYAETHDIIWFVNPVRWRSVCGIPHAQVFIRKH